MVEEVKFLADRKSAADDDTVVFWKMVRCIVKIESDEMVYRGGIYTSYLGRRRWVMMSIGRRNDE